jgi:hypothetical protein
LTGTCSGPMFWGIQNSAAIATDEVTSFIYAGTTVGFCITWRCLVLGTLWVGVQSNNVFGVQEKTTYSLDKSPWQIVSQIRLRFPKFIWSSWRAPPPGM